MEIGSVFSWAGAVAKLLPLAWRLLGRSLRESHRLTITGTYRELGMMVIAIVVGAVAGLVGARYFGLLAGFFIGPVVTLVVYVGGVKYFLRQRPVYHPKGYLVVEGKEDVFCPICWDERKKLVPMDRTKDVIVTINGDTMEGSDMFLCRICKYRTYIDS